MTVAEVGNIVEFYDGLKGRVEKINDNSVALEILFILTILLVRRLCIVCD
jgi:uncharacterized protein YkvS